jgi:hypothetical protein
MMIALVTASKGVDMFKLSSLYSEDMALAIVIWFCTLPLVAFIVVPLFGSKVAIITVLTLLWVIMAACWVVCGWKLIQEQKGKTFH